MNILKDIAYANYYIPSGDTALSILEKRNSFQIDVLINLDYIDMLSEICINRQFITDKQFSYLSKLVYELR